MIIPQGGPAQVGTGGGFQNRPGFTPPGGPVPARQRPNWWPGQMPWPVPRPMNNHFSGFMDFLHHFAEGGQGDGRPGGGPPWPPPGDPGRPDPRYLGPPIQVPPPTNQPPNLIGPPIVAPPPGNQPPSFLGPPITRPPGILPTGGPGPTIGAPPVPGPVSPPIWGPGGY